MSSSTEHVETVFMVRGDVMEIMIILMPHMKMVVISYSHN